MKEKPQMKHWEVGGGVTSGKRSPNASLYPGVPDVKGDFVLWGPCLAAPGHE